MLEYRGFSSASQRWGCFAGRFPWFRDDDGTIVGQLTPPVLLIDPSRPPLRQGRGKIWGGYLYYPCICLLIPFALLIFAVYKQAKKGGTSA